MKAWRRRMRERLSLLMCAIFDCPRVVDYCFGYVTCARCSRQLADTLGGGTFHLKPFVIVGHGCPDCAKKWPQLKWHERLLVGSKAKILRDEKAEVLAKIREKSPIMAATLESLDRSE